MEINQQYNFGLIGKNIDYSFSRSYFAEKFKTENLLNHKYENYDLQNIEDVKIVLANGEINGLNVTIPYKEEIIPFLDRLSKEAQSIGAVNTIVFHRDGTTEGHNTDIIGFENALLNQWNQNCDKALILGSGGASKGVEYVLRKNGINTQIVSRKGTGDSIQYEQLTSDIIQSHHLIVNCTPLGTFPDIEDCPPIDYKAIGKKHFLFDLIYNPEETTFMKKGEKLGAKASNGFHMLVGQAEAAWKLWSSI